MTRDFYDNRDNILKQSKFRNYGAHLPAVPDDFRCCAFPRLLAILIGKARNFEIS
jgi:hypothetical protein